MATYGKKASEKVGTALHEMKRGELKSGASGKKVTSRKQAIAIGLSEAREAGGKVPAPKPLAGRTAATPQAGAKGPAKKAPAKKASAKRSAAEKTAARKTPARKTVATKTPAKKAPAKEAPASKAASEDTPAKKAFSRKKAAA